MDLTNDERRTLIDMLDVFTEMGRMSGFAANLGREGTPENETQAEAQVRALLSKVTRDKPAPKARFYKVLVWDRDRDEACCEHFIEGEATDAYETVERAREVIESMASEVQEADGPLKWNTQEQAEISYWNGEKSIKYEVHEIAVY